jgi:hypothetical protein
MAGRTKKWGWWRGGLAAISMCAAALWAERALAQSTPTGPPPALAAAVPRHQIRAEFGFTPGLFGGLTYANALHRWVAVEATLGFGDTGFQLSLLPALSIPLQGERHRLIVGPSLALGFGRDYPHQASRDYGPGKFLWLSAAFAYQFRAENGFTFVLAAGPTTLVYGGEASVECHGGDPGAPITCRPENQNLRAFFFGRVGFGYSF